MNKKNQSQQPPKLTAEALLDLLIGLAMRKHSDQCVFTMDSRLACSCGAEFHNAKVQGTTIRLQEALEENKKPQVEASKLPNPRTIPLTDVPPVDAPDFTEPAQSNAPVKYETGTILPPVEMPMPLAADQPHAPKPAARKK